MKKHILIVDDSVVSVRVFTNLLSDEYNVSVAKSGAAALEFITREKPDLILLDYEMPVMDGLETLKCIRSTESLSRIPVFFLTGITDSEMVKRAVMFNPEGYILKTTPPEKIKEKIRRFFAKK